MGQIKARWEAEYLESRRTAQKLIDNAKRFKKEGWGRNIETNGEDNDQVIIGVTQEWRQLEGSTEMKVKLVMIGEEERAKGRGSMKRVNKCWDMEYPEYQDAIWQKMRDNAARSKKEKEVTNLILVCHREEIHQNMDEQEVEMEEEVAETQNDVNETGRNEEVVKNLPEIVLDENDKKPEQYFLAQLDEIDHCTLLNLEPRDKLPKVTLTYQLKISTNKLLSMYLI